VILWFAGGALAIVWNVFRDPAFDYRLLVVGALLPDVLDAPFGGARWAHTLLFSVVLLVVVMLATPLGRPGRRQLRRRLLAIPIGTFLHLVLDGVWGTKEVFWWPAFGAGALAGRPLPSFDRSVALVVVQELVGLALLVWWWRRFRLAEPARRATFLRTGRVGRDLVG
jgi:hypothetical protein